MSELIEIARTLRDLQKQVAALQRLEQGSGGGGLDFDDIDGLDAIGAAPALDDTFAIFDETAGVAKKATVQQVWDSIPLLDPVVASLVGADSFAVFDVSESETKEVTAQQFFQEFFPVIATNGATAGIDPTLDYFLIQSDADGVPVSATLTDVFTGIKPIDGTTSGLDADLLDGLEATAFAAASHAHSGGDITSGTVADAYIDSAITRDSEVMTIVLAADGTGSGLDADTVDGAHYEENDWIPVLDFGGSTTGITYSTQVGSYSKIGNTVKFWMRIVLTNNGSATGAATISGLPYSCGNNVKFRAPCTIRMVGTLTGDVIPVALVVQNTSTINLTVIDSGTSANMTDTHIVNTSTLEISGQYRVA